MPTRSFITRFENGIMAIIADTTVAKNVYTMTETYSAIDRIRDQADTLLKDIEDAKQRGREIFGDDMNPFRR